MSDEAIDESMEQGAPLDGSCLDISLPEEAYTHDEGFCCGTCQKVFRRKHHLVRHLKTHDPKAKETHCSDCNIYFKDVEALDNHKRNKHNMVCDVCGTLFKRRRDLERHRNELHAEQASGTSTAFVCPLDGCGKVFYREAKYQGHINVHAHLKPYECGTCHKTFSSKYSRNDHQKLCNSSKRIECAICGKVFQHIASLHNHRLAAHSEHTFACVCGAAFRYRAGLLKHKKSKNHQ